MSVVSVIIVAFIFFGKMKKILYFNLLIFGLWIFFNTLLTYNHELKHQSIINNYNCSSHIYSGIVFGYTTFDCYNSSLNDVVFTHSNQIDNPHEYSEIIFIRFFITILMIILLFRFNK